LKRGEEIIKNKKTPPKPTINKEALTKSKENFKSTKKVPSKTPKNTKEINSLDD
jgi:hypothetical protein